TPEALCDREPVAVGQHDVEQDHVRPERGDRRKHSGTVGRLADDLEPAFLEHLSGQAAKPVVVVDDQHGPLHVRIVSCQIRGDHQGNPHSSASREAVQGAPCRVMSVRGRLFAATYDRMSAKGEKAGLAARRQLLLAGAAGRVLEIGGGTGANLPYYG